MRLTAPENFDGGATTDRLDPKQGRRHHRSWEGHVPFHFCGMYPPRGYNAIYVVHLRGSTAGC